MGDSVCLRLVILPVLKEIRGIDLADAMNLCLAGMLTGLLNWTLICGLVRPLPYTLYTGMYVCLVVGQFIKAVVVVSIWLSTASQVHFRRQSWLGK